MKRIFHQRFTLAAKLAISILTMLAFYLFWIKAVIIGCGIACLLIIMIERVIHTQYVLTPEGLLIIDKGRFARNRIIPINEIIKIEIVKTPTRVSHYILITYSANKQIAVQPNNEQTFIEELKKRQI